MIWYRQVVQKFIALAGPSGSGKTRHYDFVLKAQYPNATYVSLDDIRAEIYGSPDVQGDGAKVAQIGKARIEEAIKKNVEVIIYDATNYHAEGREDLVRDIKRIDPKRQCGIIQMDMSLDVCLRQNAKRKAGGGRFVPEEVIKMHVDAFARFPPKPDEGWDSVKTIAFS